MPIDPWDRQAGESKRQFGYFCEYRDEGVTRDIKKFVAKHGMSISYVYNLSSQKKWRSRAQKYDEFLSGERVKRNVKEIQTMNDDVIQDARAVRFVVGKKLQSLIKKLREAGDDETKIAEITKDIPVGQLSNLLQASFDMERKARGINDDKTSIEINNNVKTSDSSKLDTSKMTWEEKQQYHAMLEKYGNDE